ncbi:XRE family transcriptional regulator [Leuconostoc mesenteroides]|uniref:XRE family transcriptional regulator n=1 Tax=Leuconostoc mesenteroides TaxID=1245 RepID=UPI0021BFA196|nr:XRE family transcriptional regulator [Leuconostoc mesenteroides]MCT8386084.1 LexA family transcriptional regulator [Leuconostoc mesenteroides]
MFANNLKYLREKHNMDQLDLAIKLGRKSSSSVSEWEKGKYTPKIGVLNDIAEIFNVSITDLMNKDLSLETESRDGLLRIYDKLKPNRQKIVYETAEQQYNEQNNVIELPTNNEVEIHGAVSAGTGEYLLDGKPELVPYDGEVPPHDFALVVNGDSMLPLFEDKQIIFVNKTKDVRSGQIVIADYDQQAYVKKLIKDDNGCRLVSLNRKYDDMPIDDNHEMSIFGVVVL